MKGRSKRNLALLLCVAMTLNPLTVFAAEADVQPVPEVQEVQDAQAETAAEGDAQLIEAQNLAQSLAAEEENAVQEEPASEDEKPMVNAVPAAQVRTQDAPVRTRKTPEAKAAPAPVKRDKHQPIPQEKKLQKIVFFYDDHSFEVFVN